MSYYNSTNKAYNKKYYCSKCSYIKTKETLKEKYGEYNCSNIKIFKDKRQNTFNKKWNGHPMYNDIVKNKLEKINYRKYGVMCVLKNDIIKNIIKTKLNLNTKKNFQNKLSNDYEILNYKNNISEIYHYTCNEKFLKD